MTGTAMRAFAISVVCAQSAAAASLCNETSVLDRLAGEWERQAVTSLDNETLSILRREPVERVSITADGFIASDFIDGLLGRPVALTEYTPGPFDVDAVDDLLDTTGQAVLADAVSDTPCGPEDLPQLVARLPGRDGMSAEGNVTLVAYFDDRLLELTELVLRGPAAVIHMTRTALWTRSGQ